MIHPSPAPRGVTLLIAIIFTTVVLSVSLALLDITYKQVVLASAAKQSQYAFYSADSAMECALYWDQQKNAFAYTASPYLTGGFTCPDNSSALRTISPQTAPNSTMVVGTTRTTIFYIPCQGSGTLGRVTVTKDNLNNTSIFTTGYSTCNASDPRRTERGLKVTYRGG